LHSFAYYEAIYVSIYFLVVFGDHHLLSSFPTRRSSDLTCHVLLLRRIRICRRCRTLVQAVGADGRLPEDPGICPGRPVKGSHLPLSLPRSLRALARSPPVISWSVATRRLRAEVLPSNLCWLFTPSRMILPVPVTRMRFLALLFVFCFGMVPFSFAIRCRRQPLTTTSHAQTAEGLERDVD